MSPTKRFRKRQLDEGRTKKKHDKRPRIDNDDNFVECNLNEGRTKKKHDKQPRIDSDDDFVECTLDEGRTKRRHDKQPIIDSDDDFVDSIKNSTVEKMSTNEQRSTIVRDVHETEEGSDKGIHFADRESYPKITCRTSPYCLFRAIAEMKGRQKSAVREIGFRHILELNISEMPTKMGFWVVDSFDPISCDLTLMDNRRIQIKEEDVQRVFGFPRGKKLITRTEKNAASNLLLEWQRFFNKKKLKSLKPKDVSDVMMERKDGDIWFKRHFLVLLTACLIENTKTGYIFPHTIDCLGDIENIRDWNWCEYLIRCLVTSKLSWEADNNRSFAGPALFLMVLYVDRVRMHNESVQRNFPLVKNWNYRKLKKRQESEMTSRGFGAGGLENPIELPACTDTDDLDVQNEKDSNMSDNKCQSTETQERRSATEYASTLMAKVKKVASSFSEILKMINDAPQGIRDDDTFMKAVDTVRDLLVVGEKVPKPSEKVSNSQTASQMDNAFWAQTEVIETIQAVENARRQSSDNVMMMDDMPSFSIGLTQLNDASEIGVMHTTPRNKLACDDFDEPNSANEGKDISNQDEPVFEDADPGGELQKVLELPLCITDGRSNYDAAEEAHEKIRCREKRKIKETPILFSPFLHRAVNARTSLSKAEMALGLYAMHNVEGHENDDLLKFGDIVLKRKELMTMTVTVTISIAVIDIWSIIQNHNEAQRSDLSPARFFATTNPCLQTLLNQPKGWNNRRCSATFRERLKEEITKFSQFALDKIDLFFFPIYKDVHFFLICVDVVNGKIFVIDNKNISSSRDNLAKYGTLPSKLKDMLYSFMVQQGHKNRVAKLQKAIVIADDLPWVIKEPNNDCGVYVMRHMEAFMSTPSGKWSSGISRKSKKQIRMLRVRYCASILGWEKNELREENLTRSDQYFEEMNNSGWMDIYDLLLGE